MVSLYYKTEARLNIDRVLIERKGTHDFKHLTFHGVYPTFGSESICDGEDLFDGPGDHAGCVHRLCHCPVRSQDIHE